MKAETLMEDLEEEVEAARPCVPSQIKDLEPANCGRQVPGRPTLEELDNEGSEDWPNGAR